MSYIVIVNIFCCQSAIPRTPSNSKSVRLKFSPFEKPQGDNWFCLCFSVCLFVRQPFLLAPPSNSKLICLMESYLNPIFKIEFIKMVTKIKNVHLT